MVYSENRLMCFASLSLCPLLPHLSWRMTAVATVRFYCCRRSSRLSLFIRRGSYSDRERHCPRSNFAWRGYSQEVAANWIRLLLLRLYSFEAVFLQLVGVGCLTWARWGSCCFACRRLSSFFVRRGAIQWSQVGSLGELTIAIAVEVDITGSSWQRDSRPTRVAAADSHYSCFLSYGSSPTMSLLSSGEQSPR